MSEKKVKKLTSNESSTHTAVDKAVSRTDF